ncbi:MAG: UDP-N-acetylglucosamine 2-epimerase (hydrolyzing) [Lachnospiraceae bacterium]|nr:UDP-N-acetylglucosamine 2-epimerase (hydrolyzing) [Lachnospiraceae bacterium]
MYQICVVTSTRADFGIMSGMLCKMQEDSEIHLQLVVTGSHLEEAYGNTVEEIKATSLPIAREIHIMQESAGAGEIAAIALEKFGHFFEEERPDLLLLLGDRSEIMAVAMAAMLQRIPIAHLHGGERTEGALDEACRHSITKMSQLHFTATEEYKKRVIQLGEQPGNVYCVGALGVENVLKVPLLSGDELYKQLHLKQEEKVISVTFHPVTLDDEDAVNQMQPILQVMKAHPEYHYIITAANADDGGAIINEIWEAQCNLRDNWDLYPSLGKVRYFSLLKQASMILGNSSSGIIEAPSFHIPTVNIGNRQKGRVAAESVIHCRNTKEEVEKAFLKAEEAFLKGTYENVKNPYGGENTANTIIRIIKDRLEQGISVEKVFYDIS